MGDELDLTVRQDGIGLNAGLMADIVMDSEMLLLKCRQHLIRGMLYASYRNFSAENCTAARETLASGPEGCLSNFKFASLLDYRRGYPSGSIQTVRIEGRKCLE